MVAETLPAAPTSDWWASRRCCLRCATSDPALAVSSVKRSPALPRGPTMAEVGLPDAEFRFPSGSACLVPLQTPRRSVYRCELRDHRALQMPRLLSGLPTLGAEADA